MLERTVEIALLLDSYENLLHERTRQVLKEYFSYDLSLNEIAERHSISKQAVSDQVKRGEEKLHSFEEALGLVEKKLSYRKAIQEAFLQIEKFEKEKNLDSLSKAKKTFKGGVRWSLKICLINYKIL